MKRSEINRNIQEAIDFFGSMKFHLPRWACWRPDDWKGKEELSREIVQCGLGWDITDFGSKDFNRIGLLNFNLRNGIVNTTRKTYCEKIMVVQEDQVTPLHTHRLKIEDIINRGGGNLVIELYNSDKNFRITDEPVIARIDGIPQKVSRGGRVVLQPGDSIFLEPGVFHLFYGEKGKGRVLVGEVSSVNDDKTDNLFTDGNPRFPQIAEDEEPLHLLVNDYTGYV